MNVLIACEESQRVCTEFRERGHRAFSCDMQECSGGHPEWHYKGDVLPLLNGHCAFITQAGNVEIQPISWDLIIAHPPCTYLTVTGNRWFNEERYGYKALARKLHRNDAICFFMQFVYADCEKIAIENPIGVMSSVYRKPDQIIQPYQFGDSAKKSTCLWLKGLPVLHPTNIVDPGRVNRYGQSLNASADCARDEHGKVLAWNDPKTAVIRSKTFPGIAKAMAEQWG